MSFGSIYAPKNLTEEEMLIFLFAMRRKLGSFSRKEKTKSFDFPKEIFKHLIQF